MDEQAIRITEHPKEMASLSPKEQTQLILAQLMEGGQEDDETCKALDKLTKLLNDDAATSKNAQSKDTVTDVIDSECVDTLLSYLDMRQAETVRGHAVLTTSAYLRAAGDRGSQSLKTFFFDRIQRGTYDDYIVAFCVAASVFPIAPEITADIFLTEGFVPSLGPLMRRTWKSKKVETACLEMLNAASMNSLCREAIQKYCTDWLEEVVDQDPSELPKAIHAVEPGVQVTTGSIAMRRHSEAVQNLAAVILAKMRVGTLKLPPTSPPAFENLQWR
ncbi:SWI5-dependent HO expression protein 4 [Diatrype stigma]|uniref:SWI5-dependent HO expression protein 4 n=1 Tax=Diatrype stigma TaxID=117547 RepID=A0AAN9YVR5_9PEZI